MLRDRNNCKVSLNILSEKEWKGNIDVKITRDDISFQYIQLFYGLKKAERRRIDPTTERFKERSRDGIVATCTNWS